MFTHSQSSSTAAPSSRPAGWKFDAGFAFFACLFCALGVRLWAIQVRGHDSAVADQEAQAWALEEIEPARGDIVDRRGQMLAISKRVPSCFADPKFLGGPEEVEEAASKLAAALGLDREALLKKLKSGRRFTWVKRRCSPEEEAAVKALKLRGVGFESDTRRAYVLGNSMGQVLGYVDIDGFGLEGLEREYQQVLAGRAGEQWVLRDARRDMISSFTRPVKDARPGATLQLTIDARIQNVAEQALAKVMEKHSPESAVAVVTDPRTGEILAIAGYPNYDPNNPAAGKPEARRCRAATDFVEPGSTFKGIVMAGLLEKGLVKPGEIIDCAGGSWNYRGRTISDVHGHGAISVADVLIVSSNVGMAKMATRMKPTDLETWLRGFGCGKATGAGIPGESPGVLPREHPWAPQTVVSASFGYAVGVTPLQLAQAYGAIANGGTLIPPRLVGAVLDDRGEEIEMSAFPEGKRYVSAKVSRDIVSMMIQVVERGTAKAAKLDGWLVAGKTGTTKLLGKDGKYAAGKYASSFVGFAPADDPKLLVVVVVKEPQGAYYGGTVAAPAVGEILREGLTLLEVRPDAAKVKAKREEWVRKTATEGRR
ncbi:MAG: cell division protein FtsI [Planctomycetota bacterium]|nr:MAG: cell division protein FtsI [Planctomycetota bacterium]